MARKRPARSTRRRRTIGKLNALSAPDATLHIIKTFKPTNDGALAGEPSVADYHHYLAPDAHRLMRCNGGEVVYVVDQKGERVQIDGGLAGGSAAHTHPDKIVPETKRAICEGVAEALAPLEVSPDDECHCDAQRHFIWSSRGRAQLLVGVVVFVRRSGLPQVDAAIRRFVGGPTLAAALEKGAKWRDNYTGGSYYTAGQGCMETGRCRDTPDGDGQQYHDFGDGYKHPVPRRRVQTSDDLMHAVWRVGVAPAVSSLTKVLSVAMADTLAAWRSVIGMDIEEIGELFAFPSRRYVGGTTPQSLMPQMQCALRVACQGCEPAASNAAPRAKLAARLMRCAVRSHCVASSAGRTSRTRCTRITRTRRRGAPSAARRRCLLPSCTWPSGPIPRSARRRISSSPR